jgi:hypothetical protein
LPLFLPLLLKLAKARSSCAIARKNLITIVQPSCMMCKRGKERERERKKEVGLFFFASSSNGNALFRVSNFFSLSLSFFFYYYALVFSPVHSLTRAVSPGATIG